MLALGEAPLEGVLGELVLFEELVELLLLELSEGRDFCWGQLRSKRGVVDRLSVMANLTLLSGLESLKVYQKTFILPKMAQPTLDQ